LFVSTETGIEVAVGFSIGYTMVRSAFATAKLHSSATTGGSRNGSNADRGSYGSYNNEYPMLRLAEQEKFGQENFFSQLGGTEEERVENPRSIQPRQDVVIPPGTVLIEFSDAVFFPNATRVKTSILESIKTQYDPAAVTSGNGAGPQPIAAVDQPWNAVAAQKRIESLRARLLLEGGRGVSTTPLAVMVWDLGRVPFVDYTGVAALQELRDEVRAYIGKDVDVRLVGLNEKLERRLERAGWVLARDGDVRLRMRHEKIDAIVFESLAEAVWDRELWDGGVEEKRVAW
jgi:sodium-independent sulfate anion transporter 11